MNKTNNTTPPQSILPPSINRESAIAYSRVSSAKQEKDGQGLHDQQIAIEAYTHTQGLTVAEWFQEVGSAFGAGSITGRPVFQEAVDKAERLGVPLVVASFDRVSRDVKSFTDYIRGRDLVIHSAEDGVFLTKGNFEAKIARAEAVSRRRSESAREEQAQRKAEGRPPRNPDLDRARGKSAAVRGDKAQAKADHLQRIISSRPDLEGLSLQKLADRLGELGLPNLNGKPWTKTSLHSALTLLKAKPAPQTSSPDFTPEEFEELKQNPLFGMF